MKKVGMNMAEEILRTIKDRKHYQDYAFTKNYAITRDSFSLKPTQSNYALRPVYYNGDLAPYALRQKIYDGSRMHRFSLGRYSVVMPQNANGTFEILDAGGDYMSNAIDIKGELKNGKIISLEHFTKHGSFDNPSRVLLWEGQPDFTRLNVEELLKQAEQGTLKLQNATKVILKKILAYLPK